jgi:hypothetical protein
LCQCSHFIGTAKTKPESKGHQKRQRRSSRLSNQSNVEIPSSPPELDNDERILVEELSMVPDSQGNQDDKVQSVIRENPVTSESRPSRARSIMESLRKIIGDIRMSVFSSQEAREAEGVLEEMRVEVRSAGRRKNSADEECESGF